MKIAKSAKTSRLRKKIRIRKKISGTGEKPRLTIYRSLKSLYAQMIDDVKGVTICAGRVANKKNKEAAKELGEQIGSKAKEKNISALVFDRNGYKYHGVVKEFADSVRAQGIKF